jgi:DNA-binding transcriptional regulator YdaS (Cro superfamily)
MKNYERSLSFESYPPEKHPLIRAILNHGGTPSIFAKALGIHPYKVCSWLKDGFTAPPAQYCKDIEALTHGFVTCEELRPDVFKIVKAKKMTKKDKIQKLIAWLCEVSANELDFDKQNKREK